MDASAGFEVGGLGLFAHIEAKQHGNPIQRELAQVLGEKVTSAGAHSD